MKTLRKILFIIAVILMLLIFKESLALNNALTRLEINTIFRVVTFIVLAVSVPTILFKQKNTDINDVVLDTPKHDDPAKLMTSNSAVLQIVIRSFIFFGLFIALSVYIENTGFTSYDGSITPTHEGFLMLMAMIFIIVPILLFFKTPLIPMLKQLKSPTKQKRKSTMHYTVNAEQHHEDHVYELKDFDDKLVSCPLCQSTSITLIKNDQSNQLNFVDGIKRLVELANTSELFEKKKYRCLNCNHKW